MAEMLVDSTKLNACLDAEADAIRAKTGGSSPIPYDYANNKGFADAIAAIPSGGGGTLRTTHYHGTLSYSNQAIYNPTIPVTGVLNTDIVLVTLKLKRTGTVSDGTVTWNDELLIPSVFNLSSIKLWVVSRSARGFDTVSVKTADLATTYNLPVAFNSVRGVYNKNAANDVALTMTFGENGITLTQQGWNIRACTSGVATEYEYDVYIMAEDGNAIANAG